MDPKIKAIILGLGALFVLVLIAGIIYYLGKTNLQGVKSSPSQDSSLTNLPVLSSVSITPSPSVAPQSTSPALVKTYASASFTLNYPANWGLLTCANSDNFEFDPADPRDMPQFPCDVAVKSVTVVLSANNLRCPGAQIRLGSSLVTASKVMEGNRDITYRWCLMAGKTGLDITHRVSPFNGRATSKTDYSKIVEQIIATIKKS